MALANSEKYGALAGYSGGSGTQTSKGPFRKIFISEKLREGQTPGKMHCWLNNQDKTYLLNNKDEIYFIILFIKKVRFWEVEKNERTVLKYFSYDPDNETDYPDRAKCKYIFAGVLLDDNLKPIIDPEAEDENRAALIFFDNKGTRCGPAVEYLGKLSKAAEGINQLFDDPDFEKSVVTPRRFITKVTVGMRSTDYGDKTVFEYEAFKKLPDVAVIGDEESGKVGIMDKSMKWIEPFDKQFDMTPFVKNGSQSSQNIESQASETGPAFDDQSEEEKKQATSVAEEIAGDLDLGI